MTQHDVDRNVHANFSQRLSIASCYPHRAGLWHPERNGDRTPENTAPGSRFRAWWLCERGHSWQARVSSVVMGQSGCPYCSGKRAVPGETDLITLHPAIADQWDGVRNGSLRPEDTTASSHKKVWWLCRSGHSWQATVYSRTRENGSGCPYCAGRKVLTGYNDLAALRPGLAEQWYQPLNGKLKPTDVTLGSNKKVWWCCPEHHVWQAYVYARTKPNGTDCPVCAGMVTPMTGPAEWKTRASEKSGFGEDPAPSAQAEHK